ncbi:MAG: Phage derived protein Gp49-like [Pseudomonadota bacterium]|jgi:phage-related protein
MSNKSGPLANLGWTTCVTPFGKFAAKLATRIARVLFAAEQSEIILFHAFIKKTQKTNPADIELAIKRLKEWKNGQSR